MQKFSLFFSLFLVSYLHYILGLSLLPALLLSWIFIIPPICLYVSLVLSFSWMFAGALMHLYTIYFAFSDVWWKGIVTAILPGLSEIYWFISEWQSKGFRTSVFSIVCLWYVFFLVVQYLLIFHTSSMLKSIEMEKVD